MKITSYITNDDNLLYVGTVDGEEYYQKKDETKGWSFMGLRAETQDKLREYARDTDIEEYATIPDFLKTYIDYDKFADDMEDDREERHDVQATRENEDGETLYLGFGSGQDATGYFNSNKIVSYEDYCNHFEEIGLTKKQFDTFIKEYVNA